MESTPLSQKLCALRSHGPSFLGETGGTQNQSYSPQPPIRKRLYSEDFNFILMDGQSQPQTLGEKRRHTTHLNTLELQTMQEASGPILNDMKTFGDDTGFPRSRVRPFLEVEADEEVNRSFGEMMTFDRGLEQLQEESQHEDHPMVFLPEDLNKQEDKQKNHFEVIFDAGTKEKTQLGTQTLGKRSNFEFSKMQASTLVPRGTNRPSEWGKLTHLKVEENSAYVFNPKRSIDSKKSKTEELKSLKSRNKNKKKKVDEVEKNSSYDFGKEEEGQSSPNVVRSGNVLQG